MFKPGTLQFWWHNTHGSYEVLVPSVDVALQLYTYNVNRDLKDSSVKMNLGGLEIWYEGTEGFEWFEYEDPEGRSLEDLFDLNDEENE